MRVSSKTKSVETTAADPLLAARLAHAVNAEQSGKLHGRRTRRLSVRVDPGLLEEAKAKSGIQNHSDLINVALAAIVGPDNFGAWFVKQAGTLPPDFEIAL